MNGVDKRPAAKKVKFAVTEGSRGKGRSGRGGGRGKGRGCGVGAVEAGCI